MADYWKDFFLTFIPLFAAINAIGVLPIVLGVLETSPRQRHIHIVNIALGTAVLLGLAFFFMGHPLLRFLAIEVEHFAIAGGLVLLVLAMRHLVGGELVEVPEKEEMIAVVPIGTPLLTGPATLTTLLLLRDQYPIGVVVPAFIANLVLAWPAFVFANQVAAFLGKGGLRAMSKVASLLLAAIAVKMIVVSLQKVFE